MANADDKTIKLAHKRFNESATREGDCRDARLDDIRFVRLMEQWPDTVKRDRETPGQERPMLTINRILQFRNQVINEIRQNNPSLKCRPVGDEAHVDTAEVIQGCFRHIQDQSNASIAYDTAVECQVDAGLGYFRLLPEYVDNNSFEQDVFVKRVEDPFRVYCGPYTEPDGSDMEWAFIISTLGKDEFKEEYGDVNMEDWGDAGTGDSVGWWDEDTVRLAEYYEIKTEWRDLVRLVSGQSGFRDDMEQQTGQPIPDELIDAKRKVQQKTCLWRKLGGNKILEETEIPTSFIPVIPVVGNEVWLNGKRHVHGLTRPGKDAQRQYNYMQSANTEALALAPKAPFIAAEGQLEGYEDEWAQANRINLSCLTYKPITVSGQIAPPPQRQNPPGTSPDLKRQWLGQWTI